MRPITDYASRVSEGQALSDSSDNSKEAKSPLELYGLRRGLLTLGLGAYLVLLRKQKRVLISTILAGLILAAAVTLCQAPSYHIRTAIELQEFNQEFMNMRQVSAISESSGLAGPVELQTQIKVLLSETLANRTIERIKKAKISLHYGSKRYYSYLFSGSKASRLVSSGEVDRMLRDASKALTVRPVGQTRVIEILDDSSNPEIASAFVNALVAEFIDETLETRSTTNERTFLWLNSQLEDIQAKLNKADHALQDYARANQLFYTAEKQNLSQERLAKVDAEHFKVQADRIAKEAKYNILRGAPVGLFTESSNDGSLRSIQANIIDLKRQKASLSGLFRPEYSKLKSLDEQIALNEKWLASAEENRLKELKDSYLVAKQAEDQLASEYNRQTQLVTQDAANSVQYNMLKREADGYRQIYEAMLQRVTEAHIASAMKVSNVRVLDAAYVPAQPQLPNAPRNLAVGVVAGIMCGLVIVVVCSASSRTLSEPGEIAFFLGLRELGAVHYDPIEGAGHQVVIDFCKSKARCPSASQLLENFRSIAASIVLLEKQVARSRVLVVSSAGQGEGKTTVASNLAAALAQLAEYKVLLIDADVHNPQVHKYFNLNNECGLSNLIADPTLGQTRLRDVIQETKVSNLVVLTAGRPSAPEILFSHVVTDLITLYRARFDFVIIDTATGSDLFGARLMSRAADGVLLVACAGYTTYDGLSAANSRITNDCTPVLGVILNGLPGEQVRVG